MPNFVPADGPRHSEVAIIGEGPGKDEDRYGKPFQGKSGQELNRLLLTEGIQRADCFVTNCVNYRKTNSKGKDAPPTAADMERDKPTLDRDLLDCNPKFVLLVGRTAARRFLGDVDLEASHGLPFTEHCYDLPGFHPTALLPAYHPAFGLHSPEMTPLISDDIHQFGRLVRGELDLTPREDRYPDPQYELLTTKFPLFDIASNIYIDTEGSMGDPFCLSFTQHAGSGYVILGENKPLLARFARALDRIEGKIALHNSMHDLGILRVMGIDVFAHKGGWFDTMIRAYNLRTEPQGLKPLARRHAQMAQSSYQEIIKAASDKIALDYLGRALDWLEQGKGKGKGKGDKA